MVCFLALLVWTDMAPEKDFITELVISRINLLHASTEYLIQCILENFLLYNIHSQLSSEWCFQVEDTWNAPVCRSTVSIIPTYLPRSQTNLVCSPTHVILGGQTLCSFWQAILKILAWNSERKGCCIVRQFFGWTVLSFRRELLPKEDPTFNYNHKNTYCNKFTCTILITLFSLHNWVYMGQNPHTPQVRRDVIFRV